MWPYLEKGSLQVQLSWGSWDAIILDYLGGTYFNPTQMSCKRKKRKHRHRGKGHVETKAGIRVLQPQAKGCSKSLEARQSKEGFSPRAPGGSMTLLRPWLCTFGFQSWEIINSCGLSHQVWGNLLQLLQEVSLRGESGAGHLEEGYCSNPGETRCCLGLWWEQWRARGCPVVKIGWLWLK